MKTCLIEIIIDKIIFQNIVYTSFNNIYLKGEVITILFVILFLFETLMSLKDTLIVKEVLEYQNWWRFSVLLVGPASWVLEGRKYW